MLSGMLSGTRRYTFRYLGPDTGVHIITRAKGVHMMKGHIYSEAMYLKGSAGVNTVLAFLHEGHATQYISLRGGKGGVEETNAVKLIDLQGHCDKLRMPLAVFLNGYCELDGEGAMTAEVYYYINREPKVPSIFLR